MRIQEGVGVNSEGAAIPILPIISSTTNRSTNPNGMAIRYCTYLNLLLPVIELLQYNLDTIAILVWL